MPTHLPERAVSVPEPKNGAAWVAGLLAVGVLIGLTLRAPPPCEIAVDGGCLDIEVPQHFVRIATAHSAPVVVPLR